MHFARQNDAPRGEEAGPVIGPALQEARVVLDAARLAGVDVEVRGGKLRFAASTEPPATLIKRLRQHRAAIIALLKPGPDGWSPDDWQSYYGECGAIAEHDGGTSRDRAEARAFQCCIAEWLIRNFVPSQPGRCAQCGRGERKGDVPVPHGTRQSGHVWLHDGCWEQWHDGQADAGRAAMEEMGIGSRLGCGRSPLTNLPKQQQLDAAYELEREGRNSA